MATTKYNHNHRLHPASAMQTARKRTRYILAAVVLLTLITLLRPSGLPTSHRAPDDAVHMSDAQRSASQLLRTGGSIDTRAKERAHEVPLGLPQTEHAHAAEGDPDADGGNAGAERRNPVAVSMGLHARHMSAGGEGAVTGDMPLPAAQNAPPLRQLPDAVGDKRMSELSGRRHASTPGVKLAQPDHDIDAVQLNQLHDMRKHAHGDHDLITGDHAVEDADNDDDDDDDGDTRDKRDFSRQAVANGGGFDGDSKQATEREGAREGRGGDDVGFATDGVTTQDDAEKTAKIVTCPACRLNALPLVKKFVHEYAPHFKPNLTVNFVFGEDPVLYLYTDGKQTSKLPLDKYSWQDIIKLLVQYGIKPNTHNDDIEDVVSTIET